MILLIGVVSATEVNKNTSSVDDALYQKDIEKINIKNSTPEKIDNTIKQANGVNSSKTLTKVNTTSNVKAGNQSTQTKTKKIYVNSTVNVTKQDGSSKYPYATIQLAVKNSLKGYNNIIYLNAGNHIVDSNIIIDKTVEIIGKGKAKTNITCKSNQGFRIAKG
jgi:hypothetical protein